MELKGKWDDMINSIWYKSRDIERTMCKIWIGKRKLKDIEVIKLLNLR